MTQGAGRSPPLPAYGAFVVQLRADTQVETGRFAGRVEHILSGQATHFQSVEALLEFIARVWREIDTESPQEGNGG